MDELDLHLQSLIQEGCSYPPASPQRRKAFNSIFRHVLKSGRIWRGVGDCYEEALSKTLIKLNQTLCEKYDPSRGPFFPWFNTCLRNQYKDEISRAQRDLSYRQDVRQNNEDERHPLDRVPSPIENTLFWEISQWIEDDPDGILSACHIRGNPKANCQALAYLRIVLGKEWLEIAEEFGLSRGTVSSHWCRKCLIFMRNWLDENLENF